MQTIIIKLNPSALTNPDLDLRYRVPERIQEITDGAIQDNGYDYIDNQMLGLWLQTESAVQNYPAIIKLLQEEKFLDNNLSQSVEIYISENDSDDLDGCHQVFPACIPDDP